MKPNDWITVRGSCDIFDKWVKWPYHLFTHHSECGYGGVYWPQHPIYFNSAGWDGQILLGSKEDNISIVLARISPALAMTIKHLHRYVKDSKGAFSPHFEFVSNPSSWNEAEVDKEEHFCEIDRVAIAVKSG